MKAYHITKVFSIAQIRKEDKKLYEKYQKLLGKTNKTSYQVSKETGISQTAFSNWKAGRNSPGVESLKKLADYFGVSIEYFLEEEVV